MQLCRFQLPGQGARLGQLVAGIVYDLTASDLPHFATLAALIQASATTPIGVLLQNVHLSDLPTYAYADLDCKPAPGVPHILPPADRQEVWAAGVTYAWSREARVREARAKEVYVRVYEAERPELFFKSTPEKAVGPNDWIGLRGDSHWNVPEPELVLVLNPRMQIIGYTAGNDVSSRDIEGDNPLYLPQAKIYRHACALGPAITLADDRINARNLAIRLTINREGAVIFQGETGTAKMRRSLTELADYLGRYNDFPHGALLFTGTGIVPGDDFTLQDGDDVAIEIEAIGILRNLVRQM
jgi:2-dehydro-3-deoxy-D-arabinonate dehydratase